MNRKHKYFPLFVSLEEKEILVVGGGTIASRRIRALLPFGGRLTVIAPEVSDFVKEAAAEGQMVWKQEAYTREALRYADLVLACTDDPELNGEIYSVCKCLGIPVNVCSDRRKCDFYFPGIYMHDEVVVGITASGLNHKRARKVRVAIQEAMEEKAEHDDD